MSSAVTCPICLGTLARPVLATCCGQSFCDACLQAALRSADACPMCREPLLAGAHSATRNRALEELLARLPLPAEHEHEVLLQIHSEEDDGKKESGGAAGADSASSRSAFVFSAAARARRCLQCRRCGVPEETSIAALSREVVTESCRVCF